MPANFTFLSVANTRSPSASVFSPEGENYRKKHDIPYKNITSLRPDSSSTSSKKAGAAPKPIGGVEEESGLGDREI